MFGVWQNGEQFQDGQAPWFVAREFNELRTWADLIPRDGRKRLFFAESPEAEYFWDNQRLRCVGHDYDGLIDMVAGEPQQEVYIRKRQNAMKDGCPKLSVDERARRTVYINPADFALPPTCPPPWLGPADE